METNKAKLPSEMVATLRKELRLNHEVSALQALLNEKLDQIKTIEESISMKERIGIAKAAFYQKKEQISILKTSVERDRHTTNAKIEEWKNLKLKLQQQLDGFLAANDPQCVTAEKMSQYYHDIHTYLLKLEKNVSNFILHLGETRSALSAHFDKTAQSYRKPAMDAIKINSESGYVGDGIIVKINNLSELHNDDVQNTFLSHISLPTINPINMGDIVGTLQFTPLPGANKRIDELLVWCDDLQQNKIPLYFKILVKATTLHTDSSRRYVERSWEYFRQQVWQEMHRTQVPFRHNAPHSEKTVPSSPVPKEKEPKLEINSAAPEGEETVEKVKKPNLRLRK